MLTPTPGNRFRSSTHDAERTVVDVSHFNGIVYYRIKSPHVGSRRKILRCSLMRWQHWCIEEDVKEVTNVDER